MSGRRWSLWLGPPIALVAAALIMSRSQPGVEAGGVTGRPAGVCAGSAPVGSTLRAVHEAWWRLVDRLDGNGSLVGRTLSAGTGGSATVALELGAESMASGPVGGLVAVATDDGRFSEVRLVSAVEGCSWLVQRSSEVVRSAILDISNGSLLVHLVARGTREDMGAWRIVGMDPGAARSLVLGPLAPQPALGPIWATTLRLDAAGTALAAQSCGEAGCITRILALDGSDATANVVGGPDQGPLIGFTGKLVITWAYCEGVPCPVQAWEKGVGKPVMLVDQADGAALTGDGRYLVAVLDGTGRTARVDLLEHSSERIEGVTAGDLPLESGPSAYNGFEVGADEVALGAPGTESHAFNAAKADIAP
jgi:hypothetical protein